MLVALIVLVLLLLIFVFRPVGMQLVKQMSRNELPAGDVVTTALVEAEPEPEFFEPRHRSRSQVLRQAVADKLAQEPEPVVRLVKSWITDDEPND